MFDVTEDYYAYREKYLFGKTVHDFMCNFVDENCLFRNHLVKLDEILLKVSGTYNSNYDCSDYNEDEIIEDVTAKLNGKNFVLTTDEEQEVREILLYKARLEFGDSDDYLNPDEYYDPELDRDCDYWNRVK